jgi:hypothetical protein
VQEPTWREFFDYVAATVRSGQWPLWMSVALVLLIIIVRLLASWIWEHHHQQQRLAIIRFIFVRWADGLEQPLWTLSLSGQLDAVARLRAALAVDAAVDDSEMVISFLIALRVRLESIQPDERVLRVFDVMAAEWEQRATRLRKRRNWQVREFAPSRAEVLERRPDG